jgi:ATP-dependent Lon protease
LSGSPLLQRPENAFKTMEEYSDKTPADVAWYPMVPIRDVVIFPFTKVAFKIGRSGSVRALEQALATDRTIFLATQHDATVDEPSPNQIYGVGTLGKILQSQKQDNGQIKSLSKAEKEPQPFAWRTPTVLSSRLFDVLLL